ncbi:hypothetical protein [Pseudomonas sp. C9-3]|uniref:hypothetical protein n=1 Tax=Pseudomonas sp. C9-3 TaxID=3078264 RepID=UPI0028EDB5FE|nr:hypothetical protein [Pseudomonas sp. C9-3]
MRFVKAFLLLSTLVFCAVLIGGVGGVLMKQFPRAVFSSDEERVAFVAKLDAGLKNGGAAMEEAKRLNDEFSAKVELRQRAVLWGQIFAYTLVVLTATLLYLRFTLKSN